MPSKEIAAPPVAARTQKRVLPVFVLALGLAAALLAGELGEIRRAQRYRLMDEIAGHLNNAAAFHALERGIGNTILGTEFPSSALIQQFNEIGAKSDAETAAAAKIIDEYMESEAGGDTKLRLAAWKRRLTELDAGRKRIITHSIKSEEWVAAATRNIDADFNLRDTIFAPHGTGEKIMYYNIVIRSNIAKLCEYAGRERALLGGLIAAGKPIPPETGETLKTYRILVDDAAAKIMELRALEGTPAPLLAAIDDFEKNFLTDYENTRKAVYAASAASEPYPVSGEIWLAKATNAIDSGLHISRVVGEISKTGADEIRGGALILAAVYLFILLAAAGAFGFILWQRTRSRE